VSESRFARPCSGRTALPLLLPIGISIVAGTTANWFAPLLVTRHPLLLIGLNPRLRYLVLASPRLPVLPFFALPFMRLVAIDLLTYLLGRWCGEVVLAWVERRIGRARRLMGVLQRWFAGAAPALTFAFPSGIVCLLAGSSGMQPELFGGLTVGGILLRLVAVRIVATVFRAQLAAVLRFIARNQAWLLAVTLAAGALQVFVVVRRSRLPNTPGRRGDEP
jgi:membrane protein DedA with SNARE-associated domain